MTLGSISCLTMRINSGPKLRILHGPGKHGSSFESFSASNGFETVIDRGRRSTKSYAPEKMVYQIGPVRLEYHYIAFASTQAKASQFLVRPPDSQQYFTFHYRIDVFNIQKFWARFCGCKAKQFLTYECSKLGCSRSRMYLRVICVRQRYDNILLILLKSFYVLKSLERIVVLNHLIGFLSMDHIP